VKALNDHGKQTDYSYLTVSTPSGGIYSVLERYMGKQMAYQQWEIPPGVRKSTM
jgi:hypothetical protein